MADQNPSLQHSAEYPNFNFTITHKSGNDRARIGQLQTPHGTIETPNFIFCGTKATIKGLTPEQVRAAGADIILSNTYHLMIQPGADLVEKMGGLHKFMRWDGPMFTDSGGFQIFSMGHGSVADEIKGRRSDLKRETSLLKITEEGAAFRSYMGGAKLFLSPEKSIEIQRQLGADLIVQFDECTPFHVDKDYTARSMALSHRWGKRSLAEFMRHHDGTQALYGIVQGGVYEDLRRESSEYTRDNPFFGTAIGGSLGQSKEQFYEVVDYCVPYLHPDRPIHLLGIGDIDDIFNNVRKGIDTFDCVSPTRIARHGWAIAKGVPQNRHNLRNAKFRDDAGPIDENAEPNYTSQFSRAYIHHLIRAQEKLAESLISMHNIAMMTQLFREIRHAIKTDTLDQLEKEWIVK